MSDHTKGFLLFCFLVLLLIVMVGFLFYSIYLNMTLPGIKQYG